MGAGAPVTGSIVGVDRSLNYPFVFSLDANEMLYNQNVNIQTNSDFYLRGITFSSTGAFGIRFQDGVQYYVSSDFIPSVAMSSVEGQFFPFVPDIFYPAGGKIVIDIKDLSGIPNSGTVLFIGVGRYKL
jgi:hypothetical protein